MSNIHLAPAKAQIEARLYFGPTETPLSEGQFNTFLDRNVATRFHTFTLAPIHAWVGGEKVCQTLVTILTDDTAANRVSIKWIAENYKSRFRQVATAYSFHPCQFVLDCWPHGPNVSGYRQSPKTGDV